MIGSFLGIPDEYLLKLIPVLIVFFGLLNVVPLLVFLERKVCAWIQNREGPNRVGILGPDSPLEILGINTGKTRFLGGFMQPLADAIKLITKEYFIPAGADRLLFMLGPVFAMLPPLLAFVVIPVAPDLKIGDWVIKMQVADLHVGLLFILSVGSLSAYGLAFGGWASNNKYALLGGVRAMAQMISYEIGMVIVLLSVVMTFDSVSLREMALIQAGAERGADGTLSGASNWIWHWGLFSQPLAFILFTICAFAENNRLPFDLAECEAELVGGYHTEYNSMGFGMFFQGEYIAMLSMGALIATFFLGGWHYPGYASVAATSSILAVLLGLASFGLKVMAFIFFSMWVRWTLPRFRWDQLMDIGWKGIVPLALANLLLTAFLNLPGTFGKKPTPKATTAMVEKK
ncbi:MAG TPA: complex I subunit 1 family protein [Planctomycetota bacterium]|nr:complex I subunit 1 family protein [Planctomycetota bacterium]